MITEKDLKDLGLSNVDKYNGIRGYAFDNIKPIILYNTEFKGALSIYYNYDTGFTQIMHVPQIGPGVDLDYEDGNMIEPFQGTITTINELKEIISKYEDGKTQH